MAKYSETQKQQVYELYKQGLIGREIETLTGIPATTIRYWCRTQGITRHKGPRSKIRIENYFANIDSEEKAYWLGWIIADGCISIYNNQHSLKLHITKKDSILTEKFLQAIGSTNKISYRPSSTYVSLTSKKMITDLIKLGITPNKSGKESFPSIQKALRRHMIRGYFDGDGITCIKKNKRSGFCGGENALNFIRNEAMLFPNIYQAKGTKYLLLGRKESKILFNYMYDSATIFLQRKQDRMNIICGNTEVTTSLTRYSTVEHRW